MTVGTHSSVSGRPIGRYVLDDLVAENTGTALWRATDPALQRPVGARLIPADDPRVPALREVAARAARVHDRRLVRVLDVVETDEYLGIVTEWVTGDSWSDLLTERWSPLEAAIVALEVGRALESAHRSGVTHGRLRPDSVMITDTREVRLRGLGVDAVLWGTEPPGDARAADLHGIGAILYAGLTRCWPDSKPVDGLRSAPDVHGAPQLPSSLVPDVPPELDWIVARSLTTSTAPPDTLPFGSVEECVHSLEDAMSRLTGPTADSDRAEGTDNATDRLLGRVGTAAVAALAVAGLVLLLWQLTVGRAGGEPADTTTAASSYVPAAPRPPAEEGPFPVVAATDFDPSGDGTENPDLVELAYDRNKATAWRSESYKSAELGGKSGVGIVFDLGAVRPVRAIDLKLTGAGADFEVATTRDDPTDEGNFRRIVDITGAGEKINVRTPRAVNARFVLVKLTRLPFDGEAYSGGLREVTILG